MEKVEINAVAACDAVIRSSRFPAIVNENVVRWNAFWTLVFVVLGVLVSPAVLAVLVYDFGARVFAGPRYSLFARSGAWFFKRIHVAPKMIAGAPKRFAAGIGFAIVTSAAALVLLAGLAPALPLLGLIALFASLEAGFAFCAGCVVYAALGRAGLVEHCPTCFQ